MFQVVVRLSVVVLLRADCGGDLASCRGPEGEAAQGPCRPAYGALPAGVGGPAEARRMAGPECAERPGGGGLAVCEDQRPGRGPGRRGRRSLPVLSTRRRRYFRRCLPRDEFRAQSVYDAPISREIAVPVGVYGQGRPVSIPLEGNSVVLCPANAEWEDQTSVWASHPPAAWLLRWYPSRAAPCHAEPHQARPRRALPDPLVPRRASHAAPHPTSTRPKQRGRELRPPFGVSPAAVSIRCRTLQDRTRPDPAQPSRTRPCHVTQSVGR